MNAYLLLVLAVAPGLAVSYLIFRIDKYEQEPWWALALCFALGGAATVPAVEAERWLFSLAPPAPYNRLWVVLFLAFVGVALIEEGIKYLVLMLGAFPFKFFNEPLDGIVYAVLVAMGFATFENLLYADRHDWQTMLLRAFTAVPAHLVFAIVQGYFVGWAKFRPQKRRKWLLLGFLLALLLHGVYDFLILQNWTDWLLVLASVSLYLSLFYCGSLVRHHQEHSPFRRRKAKE
jgi:RsiW-degrading membrane proteinase PrsW (M82 family)